MTDKERHPDFILSIDDCLFILDQLETAHTEIKRLYNDIVILSGENDSLRAEVIKANLEAGEANEAAQKEIEHLKLLLAIKKLDGQETRNENNT